MLIIVGQVLTYLLHRYALHTPSSPLSDRHMSWQHSVSPPYSLVANYDHPLAYLIRVFLPTYIPAVLFRFHLLTYHLYLALVSLEETFAYSGYNVLPSAFILGGIARRQERHLMGNGDGNFGCLGLMDLALGTSLGQDLGEDVRGKVEEELGRNKGMGHGKEKKEKKSRERKAVEQEKEQAKEDAEQAVGGAQDANEVEEDEIARPSSPRKRGSRRRAKS
jgi:hypothetical protein